MARTLTAVAVGVLLTAAAGFAADPAPLLRVPNPEVDLGTHKAGPLLWFPYKLRNEGAAPLEIRHVQVSCGCMTAAYKPQIPPGKETTLWIKMVTVDKDGPVAKQIIVTTNDSQNPYIVLTAKALVEATIRIVPSRFVVMSFKRGEDVNGEVTLISREKAPLEIKKVESTVKGLHVEALPASEDPHQRKVHLKMAAAQASPFEGSVILHTNSPDMPQIRLEVDSVATGAVMAMPRRIYFDEVYEKQPQPVSRLLILMRDAKPFKVVSAKSDNPAVQVEIKNREEALYSELQVSYRGGLKPGKLEGKITLAIAGDDWPTIVVPYSGEVHRGTSPVQPAGPIPVPIQIGVPTPGGVTAPIPGG